MNILIRRESPVKLGGSCYIRPDNPTLPLPGLSSVGGKRVEVKFDGGLLSSDGGVLALREVEAGSDGLAKDATVLIADLARMEQRTERSIRQTLSLAFLDPALVKAAFEGRLPRGFGLKRLMDLPPAWPAQWAALGLDAPALRD